MATIFRFEEFLTLPSFFFHNCGADLWGPSGGLMRRIVLFFAATNLLITFIAEFYYGAMKIKTDLIEATMALTFVAFVLVSFGKYYYMVIGKNKMDEFLNRLFAIFPRTRTQQEDICLKYYIKYNSLVMRGYTALFIVAISTYNVYALLKQFIHTNIQHKHDLEPTAPYNAYYPWDWQHHWSYYVVYLSQSFAGWHAVSAQVALDLLLCATATQLIMHYDHIARTLEKCKPKFAEARENTKGPHLARVAMELRLFDEDKRYISGIVAYHVEVLR
ncbi:odorant receptor 85c-like [Rhagoletis pomonella]|uniref:odorant receptor 85c-like n=1 Tax=Rhagoletis pomonella TaxID=28610 RepID=UPI00177FC646|nr:odorant receptor 85c-like [Rhagoletis pomonella]